MEAAAIMAISLAHGGVSRVNHLLLPSPYSFIYSFVEEQKNHSVVPSKNSFAADQLDICRERNLITMILSALLHYF